MRILISANSFCPAVGGYERVALLVARSLVLRGHSVKVITLTESTERNIFPFEIYRRPSVSAMLKLLWWSDVYVQNNVSFKLLWPLLLCWRPLVCVHHGFYEVSGHSMVSWRARLKLLATRLSTNISVSRAVAQMIPAKSYIVLNPYEDDTFFRIANVDKTRDIVFVGRVVSDKGIDVLIEALAKLRHKGISPSLTVAGSGPEESAIRRRVHELRLQDAVVFAGRVTDETLNVLLNRHKIMVVPTREGEGFGVVALEGIACGCVVVGSTCGGLPEAIGECGATFATGDAAALATVLHDLLIEEVSWDRFFVHAKAHLDAHRPGAIVDRYLKVLISAVET
jgi:glycogen(starch) synthase